MLIKGGDWFVDGAAGIARRFHLPELLIGATVVSIGTTLPEVMVSAQGAIGGSGEGGIAYGNAIGSIICNTALIAAITVAVKPARTERKALVLPIIFFFSSAAFYVFVAYRFGEFSRWVGIVLLVIFIIYIISTIIQMKRTPAAEIDGVVDGDEKPSEEEAKHPSYLTLIISALVVYVGGGIMVYRDGVFRWIAIAMMTVFTFYAILSVVRKISAKKPFAMLNEILFMIIGAGVIAGGANLLVDSGTAIADKFGVPDSVIALTFVALGTSLPELVTAITSLVKGHGALSLGNIIGANLFNLVLVSGVATTIAPFKIPSGSEIMGINSSFVLDIPVMLGVMVILTVPALIFKRLYRVQGILLLCIYAAFCVLQFVI